MSSAPFINQAKLDQWVDEGKITFEDGVMNLLEAGRPIALVPGVKYIEMVAGEDSRQLLGKSMSLDELQAIDAEHYRDSVIIGDDAYQVEEGFIGQVQESEEVLEANEEPVTAVTPILPPVHMTPAQVPMPQSVEPVTSPTETSHVQPLNEDIKDISNTSAEPLSPEQKVQSDTHSPMQNSLQQQNTNGEHTNPEDNTKSDADLLTEFLLDNLV